MKVTREGLGYRADVLDEGISMSVDRLGEWQGHTMAELTVERAPEGHLVRTRVKLTDEQERTSVAAYLKGARRSNAVDWTGMLETFFLEVLRLERTGEPVMTIGNLPRDTRVDYLLEPMLVRGTPTILYGAEGTGKSTLAAALAVSVATGTPCLSAWHVPSPARVLVLDWEGNADAWNGLIAACAYGADLAPPDVLYRPMAAALTTDLHTIARIVTEDEVGLLIIDSVGLASPSAREGTDANDAALRLFSSVRHLKVTSLLIDHVSKSDASGSDSRPYGSVYKPALARATYEIRGGEEPDVDGTRHVGLFHRKDNLTGRKAPLGIAVRRDAAIVELRVEPVRLDDARIAKGATLKDRLTDALRDGAMGVEALATIIGGETATIRRILHRYPDRFVQLEGGGGRGHEATWGLVDRSHKPRQETVTNRDMSRQETVTASTPLKGGVEAGVTRVSGPGKWDGLKELSPLAVAERAAATPDPTPKTPDDPDTVNTPPDEPDLLPASGESGEDADVPAAASPSPASPSDPDQWSFDR